MYVVWKRTPFTVFSRSGLRKLMSRECLFSGSVVRSKGDDFLSEGTTFNTTKNYPIMLALVLKEGRTQRSSEMSLQIQKAL